ncbi:helix-turn-helix domain-containing protein [Aquisalinus flavus]|uniref:HTH cro/C1-type domain-containing protein n=1 Tax=Aquisalinus flavus TaxID=1526572 RepID=A0A8J2V709_9PROT|nr:helix-turn-helix transcriptional regulator [Aquisalinus flavus]MBD0427240.1 helix-turn-helix transcriptional regulator [Aquisalinus flavus]UNE47054.1 helix-turn-helix transcriptional regulator [Aquisalinus flavus]GGC99430.1 hypothetical protein GCM10011342_05540 [Aquisalinus flavus]
MKKPVNADDFIKSLPRASQKRIEARAQELIAEVEGLQALRKMRRVTQVELAERLQTKQGHVSEMERRNDPHISTILEYIRALGGKPFFGVYFDDDSPVLLEAYTDPDLN